MSYQTEKITFPSQDGHLISGRLERPEIETKAFAIFAHCFTCSKDVFAASRISRALTTKGIAVLRFDFTGLGNSEGDFSNSNFTSNQADLLSAYDYLSKHEKAPELIIGHSLGGAAVLAAAPDMPLVKAVVTIAAPADVPHVEMLLGDKIDDIERDGEAEVSLAGRSFVIKKQFLDDVRSINLAHKIENLAKALLILHSPEDKTVNISHARDIYITASHPKSFVSLPGADHLLTEKRDSQYAADIIQAWCQRYLS
jgi:alpha-beta hydrolase superfamily lysophospholipase